MSKALKPFKMWGIKNCYLKDNPHFTRAIYQCNEAGLYCTRREVREVIATHCQHYGLTKRTCFYRPVRVEIRETAQ